MSRSLKPLVAALLLAQLTGCSLFAPRPLLDQSPKLSALQPARLPELAPVVADAELAQVQARYLAALAVAEEPALVAGIRERLAELAMLRAEQTLLDGNQDPAPHFREVIAQYRALVALPEDPSQPGRRQEALYQLAKAQALLGELADADASLAQLTGQHPDSDFVVEARFRQAEAAFSRGDYAAASGHYQSVMEQGAGGPYALNATYMHGWSLFKRGLYEPSLASFIAVLDRLLPPGTEPGAPAALSGNGKALNGSEKALSNSDQALVDDTLRVLSVAFSYLDGADSIEQAFAGQAKRHYHHWLYRSLGQLYLDQERFRDSADSYGHYVDHNPLDRHSPVFSGLQIQVYVAGDFPSLVLPAKQRYVQNYGGTSAYWQGLTEAERAGFKPTLHTYLQELASHAHGSAQLAGAEQATLDQGGKREPKLAAELAQERQQQYQAAAGWYAEFLGTFPDDPKAPEMAFLMAEALYESGALAAAFDAYESVAYRYRDAKRGAEAGYAALLAADRLLAGPLAEDERAAWAELKIASQLRFADRFPQDKRAVLVLAAAADALLAQGQLQQAAQAAGRVTQWQPAAEPGLRKTAWLILAQTHYQGARYTEAEAAYGQVLALLPKRDPARADISRRQAASVFKRAEALLAAGQMAEAVAQLARIQALAPDTDIAISAQFDAANYLMELGRLDAAKARLADFRARYPRHELVAKIAPKLIFIAEQQGDWAAAAKELEARLAGQAEGEARRQLLYLAADYQLRAGNLSQAIGHFRDYAHQYPQPFGQAMEARFQLSELYLKTREPDKRDFWLRQIIEADRGAGADRSDRSRTLAAMASSVRAQASFDAFAAIKLKLPLKQSLATKKAALTRALDAYKSLLGYQVADYSTLANHRIGQIYAQLSRDLMASQRPKGLDELALEQYEILLEEQAFPFEEQAIAILETNAQRSWTGRYDPWVQASFDELAKLLPARYRKPETLVEYVDAMR